ncbi:MAG: FAD-dependent monooxygenase, partial [Paracoccaceae bacterium]
MRRETVDILICGGGLAGLVCAAALDAAGYTVLLVDPAPAQNDTSRGKPDQRSTAFLRPAQALFDDIGLWPELSRHGMAMRALRIVDTAGDPPRVRGERQFDADETGDAPLGWNFQNPVIRAALLSHLAGKPGFVLRYGTGFASMTCRTSGAIVTLSDNSRIEAALVIGADGRWSAVREAAGIGAKTIRYGQKSIACTATHAHAHDFVSTEIYHTGGPFTMVPLADIAGKPASAIVWMNPGRKAHELAALPPREFGAAMTRRSAGLFGAMQLVSERALWPIVSMRAARLVGERSALIAEAAHVLPPIGAQGLNTSLNDIAALI